MDADAQSAYDLMVPCPTTNLPPKPWRTQSCLADKLARRNPLGDIKRHKDQNSLLRWIRPPVWCFNDAFAACLNDDARGVIVQRLLWLRDVASVKAFALVNRACAYTVRQVLEAAQRRLQRDLAGVVTGTRSTRPTRYASALATMKEIGVPLDRAHEIVWAHRTTLVHRPASILAHVSNGCELCGAHMGLRGYREAPVSLHACSECAKKHRVRFQVTLTLPEGGTTVADAVNASAHCVKIALYDPGTAAWVRARHMLSHKTQLRKRRCSPKPGEISTTVQRTSHEIEMTEPLRRFLSAVPIGRFRKEWQWSTKKLLEVGVDAWTQLPPELPQDLTFSALMGITETDELVQSAQAAVDRRLAKENERNATLSTFRKLYKEARETRLQVSHINYYDPTQLIYGPTQLVDLCHAANALKIRALMNKHAFGNIKAKREVVSLSPDERKKALWRLEALVRLLSNVVGANDTVNREDTPTRALCLAIARRAGDALFHSYTDAEARLTKIVRICMTAPLKLRLDKRQHDVEDDQISAHVALTYYVPRADGAGDQHIRLRGRLLNWKSYATGLGDVFYDMPSKLTPEALKRLTLWANYQPGRGQSRDYDENAINEEMCLKTRAMLAQAFVGATAWKEAVEKFHTC